MQALHEASMGGSRTSTESTVNDNDRPAGVRQSREYPIVEKETDEKGDIVEDSQSINRDEYPHGLRLFLLAGASIMGVFLISLDQVSNSIQIQNQKADSTDHSGYSHTQDYGRVPRPQRRGLVRRGILHDIWRPRGCLGQSFQIL